MPKLDSQRVKHRLAALDITRDQLALLTDIPTHTLRNALNGIDPIRLNRIYRVARHLIRGAETVEDVVADIMAPLEAGNDGVPDEPPKQPKQPKGPTRRQETKGPRRAEQVAS
jgi:hypothetical protein